ncbi:hypothetical protein [Natrinema sp. 1APR25-10V2]|uniref:hypothetical protein n=1 Tax=Natrinema sp. 1APR25-10V2 TaxID=2951081 RepID=UPI0028761706|nr:hypothetical protein [Natrinema sp. 1APR25-10V2]MDS0475990.1 hypothetical protein [Natrinema sp. 1APR25-10V2]
MASDGGRPAGRRSASEQPTYAPSGHITRARAGPAARNSHREWLRRWWAEINTDSPQRGQMGYGESSSLGSGLIRCDLQSISRQKWDSRPTRKWFPALLEKGDIDEAGA